MRGFRPEAMSDDDTDDDRLHRSVSFTKKYVIGIVVVLKIPLHILFK